MNTKTTSNRGGFSTASLARAIDGSANSIRTHLCENGEYYGIVPTKLPNGRWLWPPDAVDRLKNRVGVKAARKAMNSGCAYCIDDRIVGPDSLRQIIGRLCENCPLFRVGHKDETSDERRRPSRQVGVAPTVSSERQAGGTNPQGAE